MPRALSAGIAISIGACFVGVVLALTRANHAGRSLEALLGSGRWLRETGLFQRVRAAFGY
jgi:hypothetical protein